MDFILHGDCLDILEDLPPEEYDSLVTDPPAGIAFMGKEWDKDKGGREEWIAWLEKVMRECLRVLKPGAHGLVWALPRTSHWTATALENAGFEIRDVVMHVFGSGFPKSHNISKALDKMAGAEREVTGTRIKNTGTHYYESGAKMGRANYGVRQGDSKVVYENVEIPITAPATTEAKQWSGWGTALKPAAEHWILVRKPIEGTVADNVLKYGVGGLNIDECRVETEDTLSFGSRKLGDGIKYSKCEPTTEGIQNPQGRFPSHFVLSHSEHCTDIQCDIECAVKTLDGQSGIRAPGGYPKMFGMGYHGVKEKAERSERVNTESGGASRFFYTAKASKSERNAGVESNNHPTVKAQKLMRYLCRMITPPGGKVLDPFAGSGSTGVAALSQGFSFLGVEREEEYVKIARARMDHVKNERPGRR